MKVTFSARRFDASEKLKNFAIKEVEKLSKFSDNAQTGEIVLEENNTLKSVDIRLTAYGKPLISKLEGTDFYKVIPKAVDKLEKQLKSTKSKIMNK